MTSIIGNELFRDKLATRAQTDAKAQARRADIKDLEDFGLVSLDDRSDEIRARQEDIKDLQDFGLVSLADRSHEPPCAGSKTQPRPEDFQDLQDIGLLSLDGRGNDIPFGRLFDLRGRTEGPWRRTI